MKLFYLIIILLFVSLPGCGSEEKSSADNSRFAEVILKKGGTIRINDHREIKSLTQIPETKFEITEMNFNNTNITDLDLAEVAGVRSIKHLGLHSTAITDKAMLTIKNFTNLTELEISYTQISNESIDDLVKLKKLKKMFINGTAITEHGEVRLKDELPGCKLINLQSKNNSN